MDELSINNDRLEFSIDPDSGGIRQIFNKRTSTHYLKTPSIRSLYLWFLQTGKKSKLYANDDEPVRVVHSDAGTLMDARRSEEPDRSVLETRHDIDSVECVSRYVLPHESDLIQCEISVANRTNSPFSGVVVGVGFPLVQNVRIGSEHIDDVLVRPNRFGEKIPDPVGRAGTYPTSILYGGFASMMWLDIYDGRGGLYIASHDRTLLLTALETIPNVKAGTMSIGMRKYPYIPSGGTWRSEPFVIGVHEGDWHWAADQYRAWAESWMAKPSVPDDVKNTDGWYGVHFKPKGLIKHRFKDIVKLYEDAEYLGLSHIQFWGQMVGDGCCYRFYYPDPRLGSLQDLRTSISKVKEKGGRVGFYFNIQAFSPHVREVLSKKGYSLPGDVKIPDWLSEFRDYAQVNFDGSTTVQYPGRESDDDGFRIMCTYSKGWQDYMCHWIVEKYLKEYGADFAYVDQVFSPHVSYCFNFDHGHQHHGCSAQGRVSLTKRLLKEGRSADPNFSICIEGNGDSVGQFSGLHLYTSFSSQTRYPAPEVFAYTFPDYTIIDGFANSPVDWIGNCYYPDMQGKVGLDDLMNRVYLMGFRFDVSLQNDVERGNPLTEHIRELIRLRKKVKDIQYSSRFMDDVGVVSCPDRVVVKAFKSNDGESLLLNVVDYRPDKRGFTIELDLRSLNMDGRFSGKLFSVGSREVNLKPETDDRGMVVLDLPEFEGKVASVVLRRIR